MINRIYINIFLSLILTCSVLTLVNGQIDAAKDTIKLNISSLDNDKGTIPLNIGLASDNNGSSILNIKPKEIYLLGFRSTVDKYFSKLNQPKQKSVNFMDEKSQRDDSDVMKKRYFNGKDMSDVKMSSDFSLGTLYSTSKSVRIEVRDHSLIDGDRIRIYVNEKLTNSNVALKGLYHVIFIELEKGYNRVDIEALNEGFSGPNTAEIRVFDDNGDLLAEKNWNIRTGQKATLGVVKR